MDRFEKSRWIALVHLSCALALLVPTAAPVATAAPVLQPRQPAQPRPDPALSQQANQLRREGNALHQQGDLPGALARYEQALDLYRRAGERAGEGNVLLDLADVHERQGRLPTALDLYGQALQIWRDLDVPEGQLYALHAIGGIHLVSARFDDAAAALEPALQIARRVGDAIDVGKLLVDLGQARFGQRRAEDADQLFEQGLDILRRAGDPAALQAGLYDIAVVYHQASQSRRASELLEQALDVARASNDRPGEAIILDLLGSAQIALGMLDPALAGYERALAIYRDLGNRQGQSIALGNLASVHQRRGEHRRALDLYSEALAIDRELGDARGSAVILNNIASIHSSLGEFPRALELYQESLDLARAIDDRQGQAAAMNNLAQIRSLQGRSDLALDLLGQALEIERATGDRRGEALSLNQMGAIALAQTDFRRALDRFEQALRIRREVGDRAGEGESLHRIGTVYLSLQQLDRAREYFERSVPILREVQDRDGEATALNDLANVFGRRGEGEQAMKLYEQALAIWRAIGERQAQAVALHNLGYQLFRQGDARRAIERLEEALAIRREIGYRAGEGSTLQALGDIYQRQGQCEQSLATYEQSLGLFRAAGERRRQATVLTAMGKSQEQCGSKERAVELYRDAATLREDVRAAGLAEEFRASLAEEGSAVYDRAVELLQSLGRVQEAFEFGERGRARTLLDQLGNARVDVQKAADRDLVQQEQSLRQELANLDRTLRDERAKPVDRQSTDVVESLAARVEEAQRAYSDVRARLQLANPEYAALTSVTPLTVGQVQELLDAQTTLLWFFRAEDRLLAFVVTRDAIQTFPLAASPAEVSDTLAAFRAFADLDVERSESLRQLYAWLIEPLRGQLKTPLLGIVPHGELHYVPFAALTDGQRSLADDFAIFTLPSASVLKFVQQKRKSGQRSALAVAQGQAPGLPVLRFADDEARTVADILGGQALVGSAATEAAFDARAPSATIIHLAAHGQLNQASPLFSRILLAADGQDDGALEVHEVYGLDLARADLVVLSACQTQLGAHSRGDDLIGLTRAFIYAGSPTVVASLWSVDDEATGALMRAFYGHLTAGLGKAAALRQAQLDVRTAYPHPYYWAGFVLTGDPGPAPPPRAEGPGLAGGEVAPSHWLMAGAGIATALLGIALGLRTWRRWRRAVRDAA